MQEQGSVFRIRVRITDIYKTFDTGWTTARAYALQSAGGIREGDTFFVAGVMPDAVKNIEYDIVGSIDAAYSRPGRTSFTVAQISRPVPETTAGAKAFLMYEVKGVGGRLAEKIAKKFGKDLVRTISEHPERLAEVRGVSKKLARSIGEAWSDLAEKRAAYNALARFDVSPALMTKLWGRYGGNAGDVLEKNPYDIMEIEGIGFAAADRIARARPLEIPLRDPRRMRAAVLYVIDSKLPSGNTYNTIPAFIDAFIKTTKSSSDEAIRYIRECNGKSIVISNGRIYRKNLYDAEVALAQSLSAIASGKRHCVTVTDTDIEMTEEKLSDESHSPYRYNALQREAIRKAGKSSLLVLTGGPGTGKTTALRGMIECLMRHRIKKEDILLAAPTGKAAQRMTESVGIKGLKGMTIHRMLGYDGKGFSVDELHGKVLIVDETSMLDVLLARSLFKRIPSGMKVILVGDPDQLPSVQAGNVLGDIIGSGRFPHVHLTEIMRQANGSPIPDAARAVISGDYPSLAKVMNGSDEVSFIPAEGPREVLDGILSEISRFGDDVQVLTPMRQKAPTSSSILSPVLERVANRKGRAHDPLVIYGTAGRKERRLYPGDRVIQMRNDYSLNVFNGDVGTVRSVNTKETKATVIFGSGDFERNVVYDRGQVGALELSYAMTIHRSQGSEYPVVVVPLMDSDNFMLYRRLVYTALTRARRRIVFIGQESALRRAVETGREEKRLTSLSERLSSPSRAKEKESEERKDLMVK